MIRAQTVILKTAFNIIFMQVGRPSTRPRTAFGQRLLAARQAAGMSQAEVAQKLGITQTAYADWERRPVALRPEQIEKLTKILQVPVEQLFNGRARPKSGPDGRARRAFEQVSQLPRSQQLHILKVVEAFVDASSR